MSTQSEIIKHDATNCSFAEAAYQEMASVRYGINFCCETDLQDNTIKKELLDNNALRVCIDDPEIQAGLITEVTTVNTTP